MAKSERHRGRRSGGIAFAVGTDVEVRGDDDGFRGAWYEATVVRHLSQRRRFELVYASLVDDHDHSQPLREVVRRSNVRPRPPPSPDATYGLYDLVEAFHHDGWWAGAISAVLHGPATGRYLVRFPTSREEEVFEASQVRPQLHWVRGRWFSVDEQCQGAVEPIFAVGAHVEVSRDRENYGAAWFGATVLKVLSSSTFLVEYENMQTENNEEFLSDIVDVQDIRPKQPNAEQAKDFGLNDEVEVLHLSGWAPGKISKILDGSHYIVKMMHNEKEIEFGHSNLRHRLFWNGQEWVLKFQKTKKSQALDGAKSAGGKRNLQAGKRHSLPISVSTSSDDGEDTCEPGFIKSSSKHNKAEGWIESSQACKKMNKLNLLEYNVMSPCSLLHERSPATPMTENNLCAENSSSMEQCHSENPSFGGIVAAPNVATTLLPNALSRELHSVHHASNINGVPRSPTRDEGPLDMNVEGYDYRSKGPQVSGVPIVHEANVFFRLAEWRNCESVDVTGVNVLKRRTKLVIRSPQRQNETLNDKGARPQAQDESKKRPRKKRPMRCISDMCASIRWEPKNSNKSAKEVSASNSSRDTDELSGCLCQDISQPLCQEVLMLQGPTPILDIVGNSTTKSLVAQSLPDVISNSFRTPDGILNNAGVDTEDQTIPSVIEENCTEINQNKAQSATVIFEDRGALIDPSSGGSPLKELLLPFSKTSSMWESIKSMEVFRIMPQQPHFRPLEQYSMEFREGMAIGLMVSFANLVANMQRLRINDAQSTIEERLRALGPLEANGFNVDCLRSTLQELFDMQDNLRQCETRKAALEAKILEKKNDNDRLDSLITALDKSILELEQNLASFHERRDSVIMQKSSNDAEIYKLELDMHEAEETYNSAEENFNTTLSAPW